MKYITTRWFGVFVHDSKEIVKFTLFPRDLNEIVNRLRKIKKGEILEEEREMAKGVKNLITDDSRLSKIARYCPKDIKRIKIDAMSFGFDEGMLRDATMLLTDEEVSVDLSRDDLQIMQMVRSLDEMLSFSNILSERVRDWKRLTFQDEAMGSIFEVKKEIDSSIKILERRIEERMQKIAPNLSEIAGPLLGARLITLSGGLMKLATLPASSIQLIGAEKALFRYKSGEGTPPKHGIIYLHPLIKGAKARNRGKVARILSTVLSTAVKADAFTKRDISMELKKRLELRLKEVSPYLSTSSEKQELE